jgi:hypothetical protein
MEIKVRVINNGRMVSNASLTPSTTRISPQTYWLARLARKTTGPAKSLGSPQRPAGMRSDIWRKRTGSASSFSFLGREGASTHGLLWVYETDVRETRPHKQRKR